MEWRITLKVEESEVKC